MDAKTMKDARAWTNGVEVVVAKSLKAVPAVLDDHFGYCGHTTLHACWREMRGDELVAAGTERSPMPVQNVLRNTARLVWTLFEPTTL
jgi:hypothetical protein